MGQSGREHRGHAHLNRSPLHSVQLIETEVSKCTLKYFFKPFFPFAQTRVTQFFQKGGKKDRSELNRSDVERKFASQNICRK